MPDVNSTSINLTGIYVTDNGFAAYKALTPIRAVTVEEAPEDLDEVLNGIAEVHISFASPADGRGFSTARCLRDRGYQGRVIAVGGLVCDQYRHARQSGFDGVLISQEQAAKMPERHWLEQANRVAVSYRAQIYA